MTHHLYSVVLPSKGDNEAHIFKINPGLGAGTKFLITKFLTHKVPHNKIPNHKSPQKQSSERTKFLTHKIPNHKIPNHKKFLIVNNRH